MRKILLLFLSVSLLACENQVQSSQKTQEEHNTSFTDELKVRNNRSVTLQPEARQVVSTWLAYITAHDEVQQLESKSGSEIMDTSNNLLQIMESLHSTLPDTLRSPAVIARTNVLLTKANVLHQLSRKKQKNPDDIFEVAEELVVEFDNFKLQLNELFLKTPENFELELDEEYEQSLEPDSTGTIPLFRENRRT
jgi:hypothetical protein